MKHWIFVFTLLTWLLPSNGHAKDVVSVSIKLQWLDQFQFAGYYMAKERGFYKEHGLDTTIIGYTEGKQDVVNEVLKGNATFGTGRSSLLADRVQGADVVALAAVFQETPMVLTVRKNSKITKPSELVGRKIMVSPDALSAAPIMGMLVKEGVRPFDIVRQKHSYNIDDLISGKTDAMACYISNEPYVLQERGVKYINFKPKDYGQNYYGDLLFTSGQVVKNNPEMVVAFRTASLKGWEYAFANIEETARLIKEKYNGQNKSYDSLIFEGRALKRLAYKEGIKLGSMNLGKFKKMAQFYHDMGVFPDNYDPSEFIWQQ